jgi:branched-chain amino acid transport system ATP-binding protein
MTRPLAIIPARNEPDASRASHFEARNLSVFYGRFRALDTVSFNVAPGDVFGVAGPNGAGKSTLLGACTGQIAASDGEIRLDGERLHGRPHVFCRAGVARLFQIPRIFSSFDVRGNVRVGADFGRPGPRVATLEDEVDAILEKTGLAPVADRPSGALPLLVRKKVMLAAALATAPRILFMDEPFGGLNDQEVEEFSSLVENIRVQSGISVVLVEHKIRALVRLSHRIMILNFGKIMRTDTPDKILSDPEIIRLYLGKRHEY